MTSLMAEPCGESCSSSADFRVALIINSMTLVDEEYFEGVGTVISLAWDGHVFRSPSEGWRCELQIHCTPQQLSEKLRARPIMINVSTAEEGGEEIGTARLPVSACFCDVVLCGDFKEETLKSKLTITQDGEPSVLMDIDLNVQRSETNESAFDALETSMREARKSKEPQSRASSSSERSSELIYSEFACPDELSEECKRNLALGEDFYRIVNGHLVNVGEKRGFCGDLCETAKQLCKELKQTPVRKVSSIDILKPFRGVSVDCGKRESLEKQDSLAMIREFLKTRIEKPEKPAEKPKKPKKPKKLKKKKKKEKCVVKRPTFEAPLRERIDKAKSGDKYSHDYGDSYPFHRVGCNAPPPCEGVPHDMGWRHDKLQLGTHQRWRPGRINETVRVLMKHHLNPYPYDTIGLSNAGRRARIDGGGCGDEAKSTLHVTKRNGEILIQMRPLKESGELATDCYPHLECTPLKFVLRKRPEETKKHNARMALKARGFERKCKCVDLERCRCIDSARKKLFSEELRRVSREFELQKEMKYVDVYDTSDSEDEFEFNPPSVVFSSACCKPHVTHTGTQYDVKHFTKRDVKFAPKIKSLK